MPRCRHKQCRTCHAVKPITQFYRHPSHADGRMNSCKECKRAYSRELHWLKRDTILARKRIYAATPKARAARAAYARTERGRALMNESRRMYRRLQRMNCPPEPKRLRSMQRYTQGERAAIEAMLPYATLDDIARAIDRPVRGLGDYIQRSGLKRTDMQELVIRQTAWVKRRATQEAACHSF